jgi:23S rRNA pseudouridine1911/1915/1917 synthase
VRRLTAGEREAGRRLDEVALAWLTEALGTAPSRSAVRRLIMSGALRVDGRPSRTPGRVLAAGHRLEVQVRGDLLRPRSPAVVLGPERILYEDAALIAVDKPPGLPTVATADPGRPHLAGLVSALLDARGGRPRSASLGVHQRLDRDTSGVVLFAKDAAANPGLAAQFAARTVEKVYLALTARPRRLPPARWRAEDPVDEAGRPAVTEFALREVLPGALVVEARPRTGRKHQVRIHLARAGLPILGDPDYGGPAAARAPRLMLHAGRLALRHPLTGAPWSATSPLPRDFAAVAAGLRGRATATGGTRRR